MKLILEATPEELRAKGLDLLKALATRVAEHCPGLEDLIKAFETFEPPSPERFHVRGDSLQKGLSAEIGARSSGAGDRNVGGGVVGPNILFVDGGPKVLFENVLSPAAPTMADTRFRMLEQYVEERQATRDAERVTREKRGLLKREAVKLPPPPEPRIVRPIEIWEARAEMDQAARDGAAAQMQFQQRKLAERNRSNAAAPGRIIATNDSTAADYKGGPGLG